MQRLAEARRDGWDEWIRSEADERAVRDGCRFDQKAAERVRAFFRRFLRHSKGEWAGKPFELLDWQWTDVVAPLFGWKRPDGTRRYRRGYIEVPKKNGKSTLFSGLSLYLLAGDLEKWDACAGDVGDLAGRECFAGLDLSSTTDVTALVLAFPDGDRYDVIRRRINELASNTTSAKSPSTAGTPRNWPRSSTATASRSSPSDRATPA